MIPSEFKHLSKLQLRKRIKILNVVVYITAAMAIASFVIYFATDYEHNWSWLLIGATYTLFPFDLVKKKRRMQKEIAFREERLRKKQEAK